MNETIAYRGGRLIPPGQRDNNSCWVFRGTPDGRRVEVRLGTPDIDVAKRTVDEFIDNYGVHPEFLSRNGILPKWAKRLLDGAQYRTKQSGEPVLFRSDDMLAIVDRARGRCEVTGIPFSALKLPGRDSNRHPYSPSLDRIDPSTGYSRGNCRLVLFAVNVALNDWGIEILRY